MDVNKILSLVSGITGINAFKGDDESLRVDTIPFRIPNLDRMSGGGIPRGRITSISGDFSTGKSLLTQKVIATTQSQGGSAVFFNAENKYDPDWFSKTGVDTAKLAVIQGNIAESVFDAVKLCIIEKVDLIIVDSLAALVPVSEDIDEMRQQTIGLQARVNSKGFRKIVEPLSTSKSAVIFTNQIRSSIGTFVSDAVPGGRALGFYSSVSFAVRRGEWRTAGEKKRIGFDIVVKTTKNTIAPPWQEVEIPFYFTGVIDVIDCLCGMALEDGIITKSGAWYIFEDVKSQGWDGLVKKFKEDRDAVERLSIALSGSTSESPVTEDDVVIDIESQKDE